MIMHTYTLLLSFYFFFLLFTFPQYSFSLNHLFVFAIFSYTHTPYIISNSWFVLSIFSFVVLNQLFFTFLILSVWTVEFDRIFICIYVFFSSWNIFSPFSSCLISRMIYNLNVFPFFKYFKYIMKWMNTSKRLLLFFALLFKKNSPFQFAFIFSSCVACISAQNSVQHQNKFTFFF